MSILLYKQRHRNPNFDDTAGANCVHICYIATRQSILKMGITIAGCICGGFPDGLPQGILFGYQPDCMDGKSNGKIYKMIVEKYIAGV